MASNVTYASALADIREFAVSHGYDNTEVIEKIDALIFQKTSRTRKKSSRRIHNEKLAVELVELMKRVGADDVVCAWVTQNFDGVSSSRAAVPVLNVAVDEGLLERYAVQKSATRSEFHYKLVRS